MRNRDGELRALLRLSAPLILGYAGNQFMSVVDTAMVGRLGAPSLAGVGIGNGIFFTVSCLGLGAVMGIEAPIAQAFGAGELTRTRRLLWQGVRVAVGISLPLLVILAATPLCLPAFGVDAATAHEARDYLWARALNLVPFLVFSAQRSYLQAHGVTRPIVIASIWGNIANFAGNYVLIYGDGGLARLHLPRIGLPAFGVAGAAWASTLSATAMTLVLARAVMATRTPPDAQRRRFDRALVRTILRLGAPMSAQIVAEVGVFATVGTLAGRLGAEVAAAHQVAITMASVTFCVTLGIGAATSVRVGQHIGVGDTPAARHAATVGLGTSVAFMITAAIGFFSVPALLASGLTNDTAVISAAVPLIRIAAVFEISDGLQAVASGALRGAGDPHAPLWANLVGHWMLGLPVALVLGFGYHWGAPGLWWGLSLGLTAVAVGLIWRFYSLSSRPIARV
ncbi:MAG TPA: MATE family efflux transporter [Polyangia bacterium]|nr:MATE family efflux transporter [Polyangia bacterium]